MFINEWYIVDCNSSTPYLPALNHLQVLGVSLENQTVIVSTPTPRISDCQSLVQNSSQMTSIDLGRSPFLFSKSDNKSVFEGCGTAVLMDNGSVVTGCSTACRSLTLSGRNNCFGFSCCWTPIPHYLKSYNINLMIDLEEEDGGCGSAFLVDETSYEQGRVSDLFNVTRNTSINIPISLTWTLADSDKVYGCKENNGESDYTEECRRCEQSGGRCDMDKIYDIDGILSVQNFTCYHYNHDEKRISEGVILGNVFSL